MNASLNDYFRPPDSLYDFRLTDELFLIGHDEFTGKTRVAKPLLGAGLVGALLSELLAGKRIALDADGRVCTSTTARHASADDRGDYLMSLIEAQPTDQRVRVWCLNLGTAVYKQTANALVRAEVLDRRWPLWRTRNSPRYPAIDLYQYGRPVRLLERVVAGTSAADAQRAMLAVLLITIGGESCLNFAAAGLTPTDVRSEVENLRAALPAPFQRLRDGVGDAVAQLATSAT